MVERIVYCPTHGRVTNEEYDEEVHGHCMTCSIALKQTPKFKAKKVGES